MATAKFNSKAIQCAAGFMFLAAVPATVTATTTAGIVKELLEVFLVDGDKRDALKEGISPWARFETGGMAVKIDQKATKVNPDDGPEFVLGYEEIGYGGDVTVLDVDSDKMTDVLSANGAQILTTPRSATQAGRTTILAGGQTIPNRYMALYRYESRQVPGEFRHVLILQATLAANGDSPLSAKKARTLKVTISAEASDLLRDPVTGRGVVWLEDTVTEAKGV